MFLRIIFLLLIFASALPAEIIRPDSYKIPHPSDSINTTPSRIDPAPRETDAGRWVLPLKEIMQRTYDISGQKSEWILGTSILGSPELSYEHLGFSSVSSRYPTKLAGIFTTPLGYDGTALTLNGDNGTLFETRKGIAIDTPLTDLNWERPAFEGNALRLDFRRLVTDSVFFELGLASHSDMGSKEFSYQNVTHSPYFALGRDSSQIPFGGRNIAMNSMHIQPILTWRFGIGKAYFKANYLNIQNADNTTHKVLLDSLDKSIRNFQTDPYTIKISAMGYGGGLEFYPTKKLTLSTDFYYTDSDISEDSLPHIFKSEKEYKDSLGEIKKDTLYYDTLNFTNYQSFLGSYSIAYHSILNPTLKFNYEFLNTKRIGDDNHSKKYLQDREVGYLQLSDTIFSKFFFRTQTGMQRNSSLLNDVDFAPTYSFDATGFLPYHLRINGSIKHDNKFPEVGKIKFIETGRLSFNRNDLKFEERNRYELNLGYQQRDVFYGLGFRNEYVKNLIKPRWVKWGHVDTTNTLEETFTWTNISKVESTDWLLQFGFRLSNWMFYIERGETLDRSKKLLDTPELYYKGSIHWQNRFVFDRLGVSVRVDWQWFNNRYDCTIDENGNPTLEELKKYLALDFEARMQILQFELYSRIENFNHSIYMPASGYTPEGLRFAYGIVWSFKN